MPALAKALMTAIYPVPDLAAAKSWYSTAFGVDPYFDEVYYVGFNIGGYELGLVPSEPPAHEPGNQGVTAYWGVENVDEAWKQITTAGGKSLSPVQDVGGDIRVASVTDPYGNVIGLIENPHFGKKSSH